MSTRSTFRADPKRWKQNNYASRAARVDLAEIHTEQGQVGRRSTQYGLSLKKVLKLRTFQSGSTPKMVITADAAMRLAHQLADALAQINANTKETQK